MDIPVIIARLIHIILGVFWVGTLITNALFFVPAIRDAGPDGAKVVAGLMRRRFLDIVPVAAGLTILSGLYLYWRVSAGFDPNYMRSANGMMYGVGAIIAMIAFGLGMGILRPSMLKAAAISRSMASAPADQQPAQLARVQALRMRAARTGQIIAAMLSLTAAAMAIGRYV